MNNDFNEAIYKIILNLPEANAENLEKIKNYTNDYFVRQNASESEIFDSVINEAKRMYNAGKRTPGVMAVVNIIRENDEKIYDLNSQLHFSGMSRNRTDEVSTNNNYGFSKTPIIIACSIILGIILGIILIKIK